MFFFNSQSTLWRWYSTLSNWYKHSWCCFSIILAHLRKALNFFKKLIYSILRVRDVISKWYWSKADLLEGDEWFARIRLETEKVHECALQAVVWHHAVVSRKRWPMAGVLDSRSASRQLIKQVYFGHSAAPTVVVMLRGIVLFMELRLSWGILHASEARSCLPPQTKVYMVKVIT